VLALINKRYFDKIFILMKKKFKIIIFFNSIIISNDFIYVFLKKIRSGDNKNTSKGKAPPCPISLKPSQTQVITRVILIWKISWTGLRSRLGR
jgi:hypothetical protein